MKKLIVANWKMNPSSVSEAKRLFDATHAASRGLKSVETVICLPFPYLTGLEAARNRGLSLGGQDVFWENKGTYTGEVSPTMLKGLGVEWVIIGHSERRQFFGETDEMTSMKIRAAIKAGLKVIFCVGETLQERRLGKTTQVLRRQLKEGLKKVLKPTAQKGKVSNRLVIAYEPIWAIGSGVSETPESVDVAAAFIQKTLGWQARILYGGSVSSKNIANYLAMSRINGALVGGASLRAKEFSRILEIAERSK